MRLNALFRLAFAPASPHGLTSPHTVTRWLILQKARCRRHECLLQLIVDQRFQVLFHSPPGVLFTFPSRYSCTIGRLRILSLTRWSSQIHAGFHGPGATRVSSQRRVDVVYGTVTRCGSPFQNDSTINALGNSATALVHHQEDPTTPNWQRHQALPPTRFRLIPFRSPLLRESLLLSVPRGNKMFQFPRFPLAALCIQTGVTPHYECRVSPFGHPRIKA
jgi:hypothetical protein